MTRWIKSTDRLDRVMGAFIVRVVTGVVKVAIPTALAWLLDQGGKFMSRWWALRQAAEEIRKKNAAARDANKAASSPEERENAAKDLANRF